MADETEETTSSIVTILGSTRRDRRWLLTDEIEMSTYMGTSTFDLREAEAPGGQQIDVFARCILGSVLVVVPPGTKVTLDGHTVVARASCDVLDDGEESPLPALNITASSYFGSIRVCTPDHLTGRSRKRIRIDSPSPAAASATSDDSPTAAEPSGEPRSPQILTPADDEQKPDAA